MKIDEFKDLKSTPRNLEVITRMQIKNSANRKQREIQAN